MNKFTFKLEKKKLKNLSFQLRKEKPNISKTSCIIWPKGIMQILFDWYWEGNKNN